MTAAQGEATARDGGNTTDGAGTSVPAGSDTTLAPRVAAYDLPPVPAKDTDSRSAAMLRDQGEAVQVELDALPTEALFGIVDTALTDLAGVPIRANGMPDWPDVDARVQAQREWLRNVAATAGDAS